MKKKIISCSLAVALCVVTIAGGTLAYFTADDKAQNDFTVGNAAIELQEPSWDAEKADNLYPGQTVAKDPQVKNTGANPVYIRVKVENPADVTVAYNDLSSKWIAKDGYYYYNEAVAPDATTDKVFKSFTLSTDTENGTDLAPQNIKVSAEAVQAQGAPFEAFTADAAAAWFKTCQGK